MVEPKKTKQTTRKRKKAQAVAADPSADSPKWGGGITLPVFRSPVPAEEGWSQFCLYGEKKGGKIDFMIFLADTIPDKPRVMKALLAAGMAGRVKLYVNHTAKKLAHPGGIEIYIRDERKPYVHCVLLGENLQVLKIRDRPGSALIDLREPDSFKEGLPEYVSPSAQGRTDTVATEAQRKGLQSTGDERLPRVAGYYPSQERKRGSIPLLEQTALPSKNGVYSSPLKSSETDFPA